VACLTRKKKPMKTVNELREMLSEQLDAIKNGTTTVQKAQTVANIVGKFLHTIRLQMDYVKMKQTVGGSFHIPALDDKEEIKQA